MAKAVANATTAAFITMVGSEFVQKYLGEGPRMVRDVFRLAREHSPAIVFIDEVGRYPPSLLPSTPMLMFMYIL
jgi:26S proteasome regulatory subunit T3